MAKVFVNKEQCYRLMLDAIPLPVMLVDSDLRIVNLNKSAEELAQKTKTEVLYIKGGEVLSCVHSTDSPGGCGRGPLCGDCIIRNSVVEAITGSNVHRRRTKAELVSRDSVKVIEMLVTASSVQVGDERLALLILEDISEITRLRSIIPMCASCKRIRDDAEYWQSVEVYFRDFLGLDVSHGLCQECVQKLYPEHSEGIINNIKNRKSRENRT
jgi:hypothetical protein